MPKLNVRAIFAVFAVSLFPAGAALAAESIDAARYDRASRFFPDNRDQLVLNAAFVPLSCRTGALVVVNDSPTARNSGTVASSLWR